MENLSKVSTLLVLPAILVILVFAPTSGFGLGLSWHDEQRIAQVVLLFLAAMALVQPSQCERIQGTISQLGRPVQYGMGVILAGGLLSSFLAPLPRWAFLEWGLFVLLFLLALSVASTRKWRDEWLLGTLVAAAAAYSCGLAMAYSATLAGDAPLLVWELFNGFSNLRFFGHFQSMTLPLLVLPAMLWPMPRRYRILLAVLNVFWWMLAIASGTRGTWLAMGAAFCLAAFLHQPGRRWLRAEIMFLAGGIASYLFFFDLLPWALHIQSTLLVGGRFADITSLSGRGIIWQRALELMASHPWLGVGPMHFAYYPNGVAAHPHNALLQWAAEWGIPSAILLFVGVTLALRALLARILQDTKLPVDGKVLLRVGLLCSIVAAITQAMVDGVIVMPYSQTLLAVIAGWALGLHLEGQELVEAPALYGRVIALLAVAAIACIVIGIFPDVLHLQRYEDAFALKHGSPLQPRFWVQGLIYD